MATRTRNKKQAVRPNQGKPIPGWMWLGAGLVLGLGVATGLMLSGTISHPGDSELPRPNPVAKPVRSREVPIEKEQDGESVTYDFYTRLENKEVEQPRPGVVRGSETAAPTPLVSLQTGSFRKKTDAENMKAELAFLGLIATIEVASVDSATWYRVRIGPFENARDMEKVQRKLRKNGLNPLLTSAPD